jgi:hypothetical protein
MNNEKSILVEYKNKTGANTAQKSNAGLRLRAEQFNHLKSENKCYGLSLSLPALRLRSERQAVRKLKFNSHFIHSSLYNFRGMY